VEHLVILLSAPNDNKPRPAEAERGLVILDRGLQGMPWRLAIPSPSVVVRRGRRRRCGPDELRPEAAADPSDRCKHYMWFTAPLVERMSPSSDGVIMSCVTIGAQVGASYSVACMEQDLHFVLVANLLTSRKAYTRNRIALSLDAGRPAEDPGVAWPERPAQVRIPPWEAETRRQVTT